MVTSRQYEYGTSPRKLEPVRQKTKQTKNQKRPKQKTNKNVSKMNRLKIFVTLGIIFAVMFTICYRYSLIDQQFKDIQSMKKQYIALQTTNDQIEIGIQSSLDLTNIERYAKDKLGMKKPDASQVKYVEIEKEDKVELNENIVQDKNIFQNFFEEIGKVLD